MKDGKSHQDSVRKTADFADFQSEREKCGLMIMLAFTTTMLASCQEAKIKFTVKVSDDEGNPVKNCEAVGGFFDHWEPGEGFGKDKFKEIRKLTNELGIAVVDA